MLSVPVLTQLGLRALWGSCVNVTHCQGSEALQSPLHLQSASSILVMTQESPAGGTTVDPDQLGLK